MKKFTIESTALKAILKRMKDVIISNCVLPELASVLIKVTKGTASFSATDLENYLHITTEVSTGSVVEGDHFSFLLEHRSLYEMIKNVFPTAISFEIGETSVRIQFDQFKVVMPIGNADNYPKCKEDLGLSMAGSFDIGQWKKPLLTAAGFASNDDLRPQMTGVNFSKVNGMVRIVSTDAHLLYHKEITGCTIEADKFDFIMPKKAVRIACANFNGKADFLVGDTHVRISSENTLLVSRKIDARYPEWEKVMPDADKWPVVYLNRKNVLSGLKIVSPFTHSATRQITISMKEGANGKTVHFEGGDSDFGFKGGFATPVEQGEIIPDHRFALSLKYLSGCLSASTDLLVKIQFSDSPTKAVLINDEILLMPLMLNDF